MKTGVVLLLALTPPQPPATYEACTGMLSGVSIQGNSRVLTTAFGEPNSVV